MRDPMARRVLVGLILAFPVLILAASMTAPVSSRPGPPGWMEAGQLGMVEAMVAVGLWLASRTRRRLALAETTGIVEARGAGFPASLLAKPVVG